MTGQTTIPDPTDLRLPYVGFEQSPWTSAGFTVSTRSTWAQCDAIKTDMFTVTTPTLFFCNGSDISWYGTNVKKLKTDVAVMATGGINISGTWDVSSDTTGVTRKLWMIVPAGTGAKPATWNPPSTCTYTSGITMGNTTIIQPSVNAFLYACGSVSLAMTTGLNGQVYGQTTTTTNNFSMTFVPTGPPGVDLGGRRIIKKYGVSVVYKRETR
jgi:hypothetical protein